MAFSNRWESNNPLLRRIRQHGALTTLFRAPSDATNHPPGQPAPLILGQWAPRLAQPVALAEPPQPGAAVEQPLAITPDEMAGAAQPAATWPAPSADPAQPPARLAPAPQPLSDHPSATTSVAPVMRQATLPAAPAVFAAQPPRAQPTPLANPQPPPFATPVGSAPNLGQRPTPVAPAVAPQPSMPVQPAPALPIQPALSSASGAQSRSPHPTAASTVQTATQPTATVPLAPPVQNLAPAESLPATADGIDDQTWSRLQNAYQKLKAREATAATPHRAQPPALQRQPTGAPATTATPQPGAPAPRRTQISEGGSPAPQAVAEPDRAMPARVTSSAGATPAKPTVEPPQAVTSFRQPLPASPAGQPADNPSLAEATPLPTMPVPAAPTTTGPGVAQAQSAAGSTAPAPTVVPETASLLGYDPPPTPTSLGVQEGDPPMPQSRAAFVAAETVAAPEQAAQPHTAMLDEAMLDEVVLPATQAVPLQAIWPVQRFAHDTGEGEQPAGEMPTSDEPPAWTIPAESLATAVSAPPPLAEAVQRQLSHSATQRPTESKVDVILPRRPRPTPRPLSAAAQKPTPPATRPAATVQRVTEEAAPAPANDAAQADTAWVNTAIGPLPADLWPLIGEPAPTPTPMPEQSPALAGAAPNFQESAVPSSEQMTPPATSPTRDSARPGQTVQRDPTTATGNAPFLTGINLPPIDQPLPESLPTADPPAPPPVATAVETAIGQHNAASAPPREAGAAKQPSGTRRRRALGIQPPTTPETSLAPPTTVAPAASATPVQRASEKSNAMTPAGTASATTLAQSANAAASASGSAVNVDELARQVYHEIKRKLTVERERLR